MRRSILLSRKSPSIKKTLVVTGLFAAFIVGCSVRYGYPSFLASEDAPPPDLTPAISASKALEATVAAQKDTENVAFVAYAPVGEQSVVSVTSPSCAGMGQESQWQVKLQGPLASHKLAFTINHQATAASSALVIDERYRYLLPSAPLAALDAALCESWQEHKGQATLKLKDTRLMQELASLLTTLLGDCSVRWNEDLGWSCKLPHLAAGDAGRLLKEQQQHLLKRWGRQPYLLSRRLTLTRTLQKALHSRNPDSALNELCQVISASLPAELPMAMKDLQWQAAVCQDKRSDRLTLAELGLDKAVDEITFFLNLGDEIASQGHLSIRVPVEHLKTEEIWVKLQPRSDVANGVLVTALKMKEGSEEPHSAASTLAVHTSPSSSAASSNVGSDEVPHLDEGELATCWHPLFSSTPDTMRLATILGLAGGKGPLCQKLNLVSNPPPVPSTAVAQYLADTIMGETDFILSNGRYKILRLPQGHYDYTLVNLPESLLRWRPELAHDKAKGTIGWVSKKPRASINQW